MKNTKAKKAFIVTCVAPATLLFVIFMIIPTIKVFNMSLYNGAVFLIQSNLLACRTLNFL